MSGRKSPREFLESKYQGKSNNENATKSSKLGVGSTSGDHKPPPNNREQQMQNQNMYLADPQRNIPLETRSISTPSGYYHPSEAVNDNSQDTLYVQRRFSNDIYSSGPKMSDISSIYSIKAELDRAQLILHMVITLS